MELNLNKKIEKIAQAIYLITNHLKDNEPLKWELRKESIAILACSKEISSEEEVKDISLDMAIGALLSCASDILSLLSLASISGIISINNANIVAKEINLIVKSMDQSTNKYGVESGFVLSEEFFGNDPELYKMLGNANHSLKSDKKNKAKPPEIDQNIKIKDKKDSRQERIINLLKTQSGLSVKDFKEVISDCSEKTIQRELIDLVDKGIIKREGERRWSKYSLS
ncbi:MAG TPA: hypothetical protein VJC02_00835 [Candidatus Paceibacterota bacterium]